MPSITHQKGSVLPQVLGGPLEAQSLQHGVSAGPKFPNFSKRVRPYSPSMQGLEQTDCFQVMAT